MSDLVPETAADVYDYTAPEPRRDDMWLVIAYNVNNDYWDVPPMIKRRRPATREEAEQMAAQLPDIWQHRRIVRIAGNHQ
jgi:hypothetical protein